MGAQGKQNHACRGNSHGLCSLFCPPSASLTSLKIVATRLYLRYVTYLQFDRQLSGEPARPKDKRTTKRLPSELPASSEKSRNSSILKAVLGGSGEGEKAAAGGFVSGGKRKAPEQSSSSSSSGGHGGGKGKHSGGGHGGHGGNKKARKH